MITIEQPAMALNSPALTVRYQMWNTWDVPLSDSPQHIVEWVAKVADGTPEKRLKNLVINSHGSPGRISIGQGFHRGNTDLFCTLAGKVDKIWISACRPAYIDPTCGNTGVCALDGNLFISALAKAARCYVVASTETQFARKISYAFGVIDSFEGLVLSYGPDGNVTWSHRYSSQWNHE